MISYSKTGSSITVVTGYKPKTIPSSHPNFDKIVEAVKDPRTTEAQLEPLLDIPKTIADASGGNITVVNGGLFFKGFPVKNDLATFILQLISEGNKIAAQPLMKFLDKAFANPDPRAASDLYQWVVASGLPITPEGDIFAWKAVGMDYLSLHAPRRGDLVFDHHVGNVVKEDRAYCDPNPDHTCSKGLHFCSAPYLKHYAGGGSRIVAVTISPTDVVAFPRDYGWEKGRASQYTVVGEVPYEDVPEFYPRGSRVYQWPQPVVAPATPADSKTGDVWATRSGREVTIIRQFPGEPFYSVQTDNGVYTASGRFVSERADSPHDLVKFVR